MAKWAIFVNDSIFKLAATDDIKDDFVVRGGENTVAVTVTDSQWDDIAWDQKDASVVNNAISLTDKTTGTVSWDDKPTDNSYANLTAFEDQVKVDNFTDVLEAQKKRIEEYLENNTSTEWTAYLNNLKSIDISTVSLPVDNFQKWFNSQSGFSSKNILELP